MTNVYKVIPMEATEKFSTKVNKQVLKKLRAYAKQSNQKISLVVSEALAEYLRRTQVRPAFRQAAREVIAENSELLKELAK